MQRREQQRILEKLAEAREARARAMKRFAQAQERVAQVEARLQAARERLKTAQATQAQEVVQTSKQSEYLAHENGATAADSGVDEQANAQRLVADTSAIQDTSDTDITTKIPVIRQARQQREQT